MQPLFGSSDRRATGGRWDIEAVLKPAARPRPDRPNRAHPALPSGQIARVGARVRLEAELRSIAIDLLGPNESDEFPDACADWVGTTTRAAVSSVCDSALEALVQALDSLLVGVPPDVARQLQRARQRHEAGFV